jgi:hypothetical protein
MFPRSESRYLVSVVSRNQSQGIALMTESEMKGDYKGDKLTGDHEGDYGRDLSFGMQWEAVAEDLVVEDKDMDLVFAE